MNGRALSLKRRILSDLADFHTEALKEIQSGEAVTRYDNQIGSFRCLFRELCNELIQWEMHEGEE